MIQLLVEKHGDTMELALLQDEQLVQFIVEEGTAAAVPEQIVLGRVGRVMPNLHAAFVYLPGSEEGFLPFDEIPDKSRPQPGQSRMVQVKKAASRGKAAYLTQDIALAGRYAVLLPLGQTGHASARAQGDDRARLRTLAQALAPQGMGLVLRSNSLLAAEQDIRAQVEYLEGQWAMVQDKARQLTVPATLLPAPDPVSALLRDLPEQPQRILTNDPACIPAVEVPVAQAEHPFLLYRVRDSLLKALKRRVHLKSGGELVIDPCEAMTVIDVNTASATQGKHRARTLLTTNLEAVAEAARLMRLRNMGGIILIDLIDMDSREDRETVLAAFQKALESDPVKTVVHGMTSLGLLEVTRRKTSESLSSQRLRPCPCCGGSGQQMMPDKEGA